MKAVDCSRQQYLQQASNIASIGIACSNCSSEIKTNRIPESCFPPGTWIQKYAATPQIVKKVPSLHGAVGTFRLPWRSTAEARPGAGGPRRLRGGRAAAAPRPGRLRAPGGPRAPLDAHRGEQLGVGAAAAGEVQRGAADVLCCRHRGGWMVLHFVVGKVGKKTDKTTTTFSDHLKIWSSM